MLFYQIYPKKNPMIKEIMKLTQEFVIYIFKMLKT